MSFIALFLSRGIIQKHLSANLLSNPISNVIVSHHIDLMLFWTEIVGWGMLEIQPPYDIFPVQTELKLPLCLSLSAASEEQLRHKLAFCIYKSAVKPWLVRQSMKLWSVHAAEPTPRKEKKKKKKWHRDPNFFFFWNISNIVFCFVLF